MGRELLVVVVVVGRRRRGFSSELDRSEEEEEDDDDDDREASRFLSRSLLRSRSRSSCTCRDERLSVLDDATILGGVMRTVLTFVCVCVTVE